MTAARVKSGQALRDAVRRRRATCARHHADLLSARAVVASQQLQRAGSSARPRQPARRRTGSRVRAGQGHADAGAERMARLVDRLLDGDVTVRRPPSTASSASCTLAAARSSCSGFLVEVAILRMLACVPIYAGDSAVLGGVREASVNDLGQVDGWSARHDVRPGRGCAPAGRVGGPRSSFANRGTGSAGARRSRSSPSGAHHAPAIRRLSS